MGTNPFSIFIWMGVGGLITSGILFSFHHPEINKKARLGVEHVILTSSLAAVALLTLALAISLHIVSLPTALLSTETMFVFVIAIILSKHKSKIIQEELKGSTLLLKIVAIILILVGSFLIV